MEQLALNVEAPGFIPRAQASPVLKYVGGKRWIVPILARGIHAALSNGGRYVEPFLGGAALAADLGMPGMILSDSCAPLVEFYQTLVADPSAVLHAIECLIGRWGYAEPDYYAVRQWEPDTATERAARFLYLNKLCFNGVLRFNRAGKFNVPWGKRKIDIDGPCPLFESWTHVERFAAAFRDSTIRHADFRETLGEVQAGDVVFADPPYAGTFDAYTSSGFPEAAQEELAVTLEYLAKEVGAIVFMTNADTPDVRRWYAWGDLVPTAELRSVNSKADGRDRTKCVLVTNRMDLVGVA